MSRVFLLASMMAVVALVAVQAQCTTDSVYLTAYGTSSSAPANTVSTALFTVPLSAPSALTFTRDSVIPSFPAPTEIDSLRKDQTVFVAGIDTLYLFHAQDGGMAAHSNHTTPKPATKHERHSQSKHKKVLTEDSPVYKAREARGRHKRSPNAISVPKRMKKGDAAPTSQYWSYSLFTNSSTYIFPVPGYSVTCAQYDYTLDLIFGLSAVQQADGQWNVSLIEFEYDGDYYDFFIPFYSILLPDPVGSIEDPDHPVCAHNSDLGQFTFHWPAPANSPVAELGGSLMTINVTYVDFTPAGVVAGNINWPVVQPDNLNQPLVWGFSYSPYYPGQLAFFGNLDLPSARLGNYLGFVDPLAGEVNAVSSPITWYPPNKPRFVVTNPPNNEWAPHLFAVDFEAPFNYAVYSPSTGELSTSTINSFPSASPSGDDFTVTQIVGLNTLN